MPFVVRLLWSSYSLCIPFAIVMRVRARLLGKLDMYVSTGQSRGKTIDTDLQTGDGSNDLITLLDGSSSNACDAFDHVPLVSLSTRFTGCPCRLAADLRLSRCSEVRLACHLCPHKHAQQDSYGR